MRDSRTLVLLIILALFTVGCGARPSIQEPAALEAAPVWPPPPAEPRIRYVQSISSPYDIGIKKSFFGRLAEALFGKSEARLIRPTGVVEHDGVIYIADPGAQALWILDTARRRFAKVSQAGETLLASPVALAARPDGAVFVADSWLNKVFLLDREGQLLRVAAEEGLERPAALAYDATAERLYIADSKGHRIMVYGPDGALLRTWGKRGRGDGEFNYPTHLTLDRSGNLLVTDALNFRIQAFDREGRFLWKMGRHGDGSGDLAAPKGVAADSRGQLYIVDALFDAVQIFERKGALLLAFGERGTKRGQFWLPAGIFISPGNRVYVADSYNQRVQVFEFLGDRDRTSR